MIHIRGEIVSRYGKQYSVKGKIVTSMEKDTEMRGNSCQYGKRYVDEGNS
jgi:hypothetical protein